MSDLRPEESDVSDRSELPPDLLSLHDRLMGAGARWRWRAPGGDRLAHWTHVMLADEEDAATDGPHGSYGLHGSRLPTRRLGRQEMDPIDTIPSPVPKGPMRDMTRTRFTRLRGFIGAAAAIVVVGLIALLLTRGLATLGTGGDGDSTLNPTSTIPPTPGPTGTPQNPQITQFQQPDQLPVVAQSNSSIVYKIANGALLRSSDAGASYTTEALPKSDLSSIDSMSLAVSPLDPTHIFVTMGGKKNDQGCLPPNNPYPAIATHGGVLASGYVPCAEQYMSADSGHTWFQPHLPTGGVLGALNVNFRSSTGVYGGQSYTFQTQGQRLYAAMAFDNMGGSLADSPGVRLVASDDGGATWSFVDTNLAASDRYICDFAAAPTGATLYAITGNQQCGLMSWRWPNLSLWSSADGGQNWTRVRSLPDLGDAGLVVNAQGDLYAHLPQIIVQGHVASQNAGPAYAYVSSNGGATLTPATSAGLPNGSTLIGPYITLANGAVVYAVYSSSNGQVGPNDLYSWQPGAASWTKIGADVPEGIAAVTAESASADATQQTLVVIDGDGNISLVKAPLGQ